MTAAGPGPSRMFRGESMAPPGGTHWRFSQGQIDNMESEKRIYYSASGKPYVKSYLDERKGRPLQDAWNDIVMPKSGKERIGYPTQKPLALLDRIIKASSNAGDVVLDPFAGCATACVSAETLGRQWVGIDLSELAASLRRDSKKRSSCSTRFTTETTSRSERTLGSSRATERTGISYSANRRDGAEGVVWPSRFATSPSTTWCHKVRAARTTSTTCNFCVGHVIL